MLLVTENKQKKSCSLAALRAQSWAQEDPSVRRGEIESRGRCAGMATRGRDDEEQLGQQRAACKYTIFCYGFSFEKCPIYAISKQYNFSTRSFWKKIVNQNLKVRRPLQRTHAHLSSFRWGRLDWCCRLAVPVGGSACSAAPRLQRDATAPG